MSLLFGIPHLNALPWGFGGVVLTSIFAYVQLGIVKNCGGRIGQAVLVHFVADVALLGLVFRGSLNV